MEQEYGIRLEAIRNSSLFENNLNVYALWQYKRLKNYHFWKRLYVQNREEFLRKLQVGYPSMTRPEVSNFIRIYLASSIDESNCEVTEYLLNDRIWILKGSFLRPYLKEKGDYNSIWMNENNGRGLLFPKVIFSFSLWFYILKDIKKKNSICKFFVIIV